MGQQASVREAAVMTGLMGLMSIDSTGRTHAYTFEYGLPDRA
jgi:hypothetical protein